VVAARIAEGEFISYLDGRDRYGERDAARHPFPDGLHPDAAFYEEIGQRFAASVSRRADLCLVRRSAARRTMEICRHESCRRGTFSALPRVPIGCNRRSVNAYTVFSKAASCAGRHTLVGPADD